MTHIVYETTNTVNGKIYIGVHNNTNPDYLGSGVVLNKAIAKYGRENFTRKTIETNTAEKCYELENLIVDEEFVARNDTYNLMIGGLGCGGHSEESKAKMSRAHKGQKFTPEWSRNKSLAQTGEKNHRFGKPGTLKGVTGSDHPCYGIPCSEERRVNISKALKGRKFTDEHKANMAKSANNKGENNPRYGVVLSDEVKNNIREGNLKYIAKVKEIQNKHNVSYREAQQIYKETK